MERLKHEVREYLHESTNGTNARGFSLFGVTSAGLYLRGQEKLSYCPLPTEKSVSNFRISKISQMTLSLRCELVNLSNAAFGGEPWAQAGILPPNILVYLASKNATVFTANCLDTNELLGLSIGIILDSVSIETFGLKLANDIGAQSGDFHLTSRAVSRAHRGEGIGRALTLCRLEYAREIGCRFVYGETIASNSGVIAMHANLGFDFYHREDLANDSGLYQRVYFRKQI